MKQPNILFIMTDQQRWDAMGCSGGWIETPHMDRIAKQGVRFTNCVTTSPVCISARASMATGLYPHNTGIWHNVEHTLSPDTPTWMQSVRAAGYRTSLFGKTHLHPHRGDLRDQEHLMHAYGLDDVDEIGGPRASARVLSHMTAAWEQNGLWEAYQHDFDERFENKPHVVRPSTLPVEWYADVYVGNKARTYLSNYEREEPWCCWVSFGGPHEPWDTPEPYASRHLRSNIPDAADRPRDHEGRPRGTIDDRFANAPRLDPGDIEAMRVDYAGNVSLIDEQIGLILDTVEARGELENTAIILTSDHGEMNGDAGLIYKENFLDGAVRVPMLVRTPDTCRSDCAGTVNNSFVEWFDAGPTIVELAGGTISHPNFARSLMPVLTDPAGVHRQEAISEYRYETMILNHQWKMAVNADRQPYLLFDRITDQREAHNLAGRSDMREVEASLLDNMNEFMESTQVQLK
ncbi:MAG: sulfatase-like hydrolase/transferase [Candidatus Latescibacteria bacterium]|nr:sulfatase-like hydrolase/transferase [Candidatus Latescibacterota bacterium]